MPNLAYSYPFQQIGLWRRWGGPYSEWMIQEGPIDFRVRWRASLWPSSIKKSELDAFRERYKIPNTIEMFVPALDGKLVILERQ